MKALFSIAAIYFALSTTANADSVFGFYKPNHSKACRAMNITQLLQVAPAQQTVGDGAGISTGCFKFGENDCLPGEGGFMTGGFQYGPQTGSAPAPTINLGGFHFGEGSDPSRPATISMNGFVFGPESFTATINKDGSLTIEGFLGKTPLDCILVKVN